MKELIFLLGLGIATGGSLPQKQVEKNIQPVAKIEITKEGVKINKESLTDFEKKFYTIQENWYKFKYYRPIKIATNLIPDVEFVQYENIYYPEFTKSHGLILEKLNPKPKNYKVLDERLLKLESAVERHNKEKPEQWSEIMTTVKEENNNYKKLVYINKIFNEVPYRDGTDGTWATPNEILTGKLKAVCKDYVTSKFIALLESEDFKQEDIRVAVLTPKTTTDSNVYHVVLLVKLQEQSEPLVLELKPNFIAQQELVKAGVSKLDKVAQIKEAGLDIDEIISKKGVEQVIPLSQYPKDRGLVWIGNLNGSKFFGVKDEPNIDDFNNSLRDRLTPKKPVKPNLKKS